jgi:hypothetical protein
MSSRRSSHHEHARERALRAARAVSFTAFALAATGCASSVNPVLEDSAVVQRADARPMIDAATTVDAVADVRPDSDRDCFEAGTNWDQCCNEIGWDWNRGCAAWGPFMPPEMQA